MAKKKYYAVAKGREPGIYTKWGGKDGAQAQIIRYSGQDFKGFPTIEEAEIYFKAHSQSDLNETATSNTELKSKAEDSQNGNRVVIYTDGSCRNNPGSGGYGVVISNNGDEKELSGGYRLTTNNRMELMACIVALGSLEKPSSVLLHSDSTYVLDGISNGWAKKWRSNNWIKPNRKPALNTDLWARLLDLYDKHDVALQWVKGHAGIDGNERCDKLANKAALNEDLLIDESYEKSINEFVKRYGSPD